MSRASCTYRLIQDPRLGGSGHCIGDADDTFLDLVDELRNRYGARLLQVVDDQTGEIATFGNIGNELAGRELALVGQGRAV